MLFSVQLVEAFGFMFFSFIHETLDFLLESFADTTSTPKKKKKKEERNEYFHEASHYSMHKTIASNDD
jgi:hypothetical protein